MANFNFTLFCELILAISALALNLLIFQIKRRGFVLLLEANKNGLAPDSLVLWFLYRLRG